MFRAFIWWVMRRFEIKEYIVCIVQAMYRKAKSRVVVNCTFTENFEVHVRVHHCHFQPTFIHYYVWYCLMRTALVASGNYFMQTILLSFQNVRKTYGKKVRKRMGRKSAGTHFITCPDYSHWVHKKCCHIKGRVKPIADYWLEWGLNSAWLADARTCEEWLLVKN